MPGASPETSPPPSPDRFEPAPTDYLRNIWVLVVIVAVVGLAWLVKTMSGPEPADTMPEPATTTTPTPPPMTYADVIRDHERRMERAVLPVAGGERRMLYSPGYDVVGNADKRIVFDVTQTADGVDLSHFRTVGLPDAPAIPGQDAQHALVFTPAREVTSLAPAERVVVLTRGEQTRAYPLRALAHHWGIVDAVGEERVLVVWSWIGQMACALSLPPDAPQQWANSGQVLGAAPVFYDRESGSLWDARTSRALTGSRAGEQLGTVPVRVEAWQVFALTHPDASVLTDTGYGGRAAQDARHMAALRQTERYLGDGRLSAPPAGFDPEGDVPPAPKAFVLGVRAGDQARAYPLDALTNAPGHALNDTLAGRELTVTGTSLRTALVVAADGEPVDARVMLWVAWKAAEPETDVHGATDEAPVDSEP